MFKIENTLYPVRKQRYLAGSDISDTPIIYYKKNVVVNTTGDVIISGEKNKLISTKMFIKTVNIEDPSKLYNTSIYYNKKNKDGTFSKVLINIDPIPVNYFLTDVTETLMIILGEYDFFSIEKQDPTADFVPILCYLEYCYKYNVETTVVSISDLSWTIPYNIYGFSSFGYSTFIGFPVYMIIRETDASLDFFYNNIGFESNALKSTSFNRIISYMNTNDIINWDISSGSNAGFLILTYLTSVIDQRL